MGYNNQSTPAALSLVKGDNRRQSLLLLKSGNVGIGTTAPASTLTIVGNFSATGTKSAVVNTSYGIRKCGYLLPAHKRGA